MRNWLIQITLCGVAILAAVVAFVVTADVFALYGARLTRAVPQNLRLTTSGDRTIKALEIAAMRDPLDLLFIGSSRVAFAFDPDAPILAGLRSYNAGLHGSHSIESAAVLDYALERGPRVARIVWNIDFEEFYRESKGSGDFAQSPFAGASTLQGMMRHTLSYEALRKSMAIYFGWQSFYMDVSGFYHYERQRASHLINGRDHAALPTMRDWFPPYIVQPQDGFAATGAERFARIVAAIRHARARGVAVDVVCMPSHVARRAMFDLAGLQPKYEEWKRRLAEVVAEAGAGDGPPVRGFDFCEAGEIARAAFQPAGPLDRSPLFFELVHPKPVIGEMIVARLLDRPPPLPAEPGFGDPLAESAEPERLAADRAAVRRWEAENPQLVAFITGVIEANDRRPPTAIADAPSDAHEAALEARP
ncbi:MAG TPA: hypothetical protein VIG55_06265 [Methylosinus sp.]